MTGTIRHDKTCFKVSYAIRKIPMKKKMICCEEDYNQNGYDKTKMMKKRNDNKDEEGDVDEQDGDYDDDE